MLKAFANSSTSVLFLPSDKYFIWYCPPLATVSALLVSFDIGPSIAFATNIPTSIDIIVNVIISIIVIICTCFIWVCKICTIS